MGASARSWTRGRAGAGADCPVLCAPARGRRAPGLPLLFLLRWARPSPRKPPAALPTLPATAAAAAPGRPPHGGRPGRTGGRLRPSLGSAGAPFCGRDGCGESGLESPPGQLWRAPAPLPSLARPARVRARPSLGARKRREGQRLEARPGGRARLLRGGDWGDGPQGAPVGGRAWWPRPAPDRDCALRALSLAGALSLALSSKRFQSFGVKKIKYERDTKSFHLKDEMRQLLTEYF